MKKHLTLVLSFLFLLTACANNYIPEAKVTFKVVDMHGNPISNEDAALGFSPTIGFHGKTDENGYFTGRGRTESDYVFSVARKSNKYYRTRFSKDIAHWKDYPKDGKWKPWNETIEIVVKEKINPIPVYANGIKFKTNIPVVNEWVGYDFEYNDWVTPHGKGLVADVEVSLSEEKPTEEEEIEELKIRFPYPLAGAYVMKKDLNCDFQSVYHANPNATYQQEIRWYKAYKMMDDINPHAWTEEERYFKVNRMVKYNLLSKDDYLIFRTRTKVDENGNLIEARYGKIYGPIEFRLDPTDTRPSYRKRVELRNYYFNPTVNDTNLEYDSKRNLLLDKVAPRERRFYL